MLKLRSPFSEHESLEIKLNGFMDATAHSAGEIIHLEHPQGGNLSERLGRVIGGNQTKNERAESERRRVELHNFMINTTLSGR